MIVITVRMFEGIPADSPDVKSVQDAMSGCGYCLLEGPWVNSAGNCVMLFRPVGIKTTYRNSLFLMQENKRRVAGISFDHRKSESKEQQCHTRSQDTGELNR